MVSHCSVWGIWRERNAQTFEGNESSIRDMKMSFFHTQFGWTNSLGVLSFSLLSNLLDRCTFFLLSSVFVTLPTSVYILSAMALFVLGFFSVKFVSCKKEMNYVISLYPNVINSSPPSHLAQRSFEVTAL